MKKKNIFIVIAVILIIYLFTSCGSDPHTHSYTIAKFDEKTHWMECSCGEKSEVENHTFGEWKTTKKPTETTAGTKERKCNSCQYKETETIPQLVHTHSYTVAKFDEKTHWMECSCGEKSEVENHTFGEWTIGIKSLEVLDKKCTMCDYKDSVSIDSLKETTWNDGSYLGNTENPYLCFSKPKSSDITTFEIHVNTKVICPDAFNYCTKLTSIEIPNGVNSIGIGAFYNCSKLTGIEIPNSVISIGNSVFYECRSLTSINIGSGVKDIGNSAFNYCVGLENVYYEKRIEDWCNICFGDFHSNPMVEAESFYMRNSNHEWEEVNSLEIPNTVAFIGDYQFSGFKHVANISIPSSVISIGKEAFANCSSLTSIAIPNTVTSIGSFAFLNCSTLNSLELSTGITSIGEETFSNCSSLTSIVIPNGVTTIGKSAFYNCSSLTTITIPSSVTSIGDKAFYNCSSLATITLPNSVTSIGEFVFYKCSKLTSITIPNHVTSLARYAFAWCNNLTSIVIPKSVTLIDSDAFVGCYNMKEAYYEGSSQEWSNVSEGSSVFPSTSIIIYYYSETKPATSGNYWHYVDGKITKW